MTNSNDWATEALLEDREYEAVKNASRFREESAEALYELGLQAGFNDAGNFDTGNVWSVIQNAGPDPDYDVNPFLRGYRIGRRNRFTNCVK
jgi:hypothetical protein